MTAVALVATAVFAAKAIVVVAVAVVATVFAVVAVYYMPPGLRFWVRFAGQLGIVVLKLHFSVEQTVFPK